MSRGARAVAAPSCDQAHVHAPTDPMSQRIHRLLQQAANKRAQGEALIRRADEIEALVVAIKRMDETGYGPTHSLG